MLASIHPLGERARQNRWGLTVAAYTFASVMGGAAVGAGLGALGWGAGRIWAAPAAARLGLVAAGVVAAAAWDLLSGRSLPPYRQVDEDWLATYRGWVYGAGFGAQLGAGLTTIVTTALVPFVFLLTLVGGSASWGALVGAGFGASRAVPVLATRGLVTAPALRGFHARMHALYRPARLAAVGMSLGAVVAGTVAVVVGGAR